jgi:hypothetical protein
LSYPDGLSINDGIAKEDSAVSYQTIDDAMTLIKQFGKGALLSKTDIERAPTLSDTTSTSIFCFSMFKLSLDDFRFLLYL